jgi:hypothetical protein
MAWRLSPLSDPSRVQVNEVGSSVVADTAAPHRQGRVAESSGVKIGKPNVDGFSNQVQAVFRNAVSLSP